MHNKPPKKPINPSINSAYKKRLKKISLDGKLDEAVWEHADVAHNFWLAFPTDDRRADANIQTEVRTTYDDQYIYIGAICYGPNDYIIPTLKRDAPEFWSGDVFGVLIDPVNESTNGFNFAVNPAGVQVEALISGRTGTRAELNSRGSSSGINTAWDNKWYVEVSSDPDYWTVEMAIPFKTLRFDPEKTAWGINFTRGEPRSNSWHCWSPVPVQFLTLDLGYTGALVWDKPPAKIKSNISLIPYTLGSYAQDFEEGENADGKFRMGADAKVAITSSLNLDATINPDFSQVEVDQQVTNLTTINIRFPERRLFFLENSDLFSNFGIPPMRPFFSRRIGLDEDGNTIPILYGLRLSGNLTKDLRVGVMNMHTRKTDEFYSQNYTSVALHQQVLNRSVIRGYFHNREALQEGETVGNDYNRIAGLEFQYFSQDAKWQGFGGGGVSMSDGLEGENYFYNVGGGYDGRNFSWYSNLSGAGKNYYADMGWLPAADRYDALRDTTIHIGFHHWYTRLTYLFYPKDQSTLVSHGITLTHIVDVDSDLDLIQNRIRPTYAFNFTNTSRLTLEYQHEDHELLYPFDFTDGEPLPVGRYNFDYIRADYISDARKYFSWIAGLQYGTFFNGDRLETLLGLRYRVQPWGNFGLNFVYNKLEFPEPYGEEDLLLISPRLEFNFTRNLFWTTFLQFNTQRDNFNINSRLQWRFQPMSDLFIVYTDNYAIDVWQKKNRALVVKLNYWLNL